MKTVNTISKFLSLIFAIILVFALPFSLIAFNVYRVLFDPPYVKEVISDIAVESDLLPVALSWYSEVTAKEHVAEAGELVGITEPNIFDLIMFMDVDDWRNIKEEVLTRPIIEEFVSTSVDGVYIWVDSTQEVPDITWQLNSFIDRVDTEHGLRSIEIAYSALPECSPEQISDFETRLSQAPPNTEVLYNLCQFPEPYFEDQFSDYLQSLEDLVKNIPKEFGLTDAMAAVEQTPGGAGPRVIKEQLRNIRQYGSIAWMIPLVILALILVLGVRSLISMGRWWGVPLVFGGVISLILTLVYKAVITSILSLAIFSEVPPLITHEATLALIRFADEIFRPMMLHSFIVVALGFILLIVSAVLGRSKDEAAPGEFDEGSTPDSFSGV